MSFGPEEFLKRIPHRPPFLWIDLVVFLDPGRKCSARKVVQSNLPFFAGHFPGTPVLPGVFLIEAAAQTAAVMTGCPDHAGPGASESAKTPPAMLVCVTRFKFLKPVLPDSELLIHTKLLSQIGPVASVEATIEVGGDTVAKGELLVSMGASNAEGVGGAA